MSKGRITEQTLWEVAVDSVLRTGGLTLFWANLQRMRFKGWEVNYAEIKDWTVRNNSEIFRKGRPRDPSIPEPTPMSFEPCYNESGLRSWGDPIEGDALDGFLCKVIPRQPLEDEIPDYVRVIAGRNPPPRKVYLLSYEYRVREGGIIQPLFKVVAEYPGPRTPMRQLFIVGRDRHTRDPFALGVPNGFIDYPIEAALRWTMDLHKGDEAVEI